MTIITVFKYNNEPQNMLPLYNILNQIKTGKYRRLIEKFRNCYKDDPGGEFDSLARVIPRFSVSGNFILKNGEMKMVSYSGNLCLEIPYLNDQDMKSVKFSLRKDPYVMAFFENVLKNGLVILVRSDGKVEGHQANFQLAVKYYQAITGVKNFSSGGILEDHTCMVSLDEDAYIGLEAISFTEVYKQRESKDW